MYSYKVKRSPENKHKYKYMFNSKSYDIDLNNNNPTSFDSKIGATRADPNNSLTFPDKIKSNNSFTLQRITKKDIDLQRNVVSTTKKKQKQTNMYFKLPGLKRIRNPQQLSSIKSFQLIQKKTKEPNIYYQSKIHRAFKSKQNTYLMSLARQHFIQTIQAIRIGKNLKLVPPKRQIKVPKKNQNFKTIFLDLDQCLIHCDQTSTNYTVKLKFPIDGGASITAGVKIRPHCEQFIKQLSTFAQIIIFTASASSYADVVLDYLDPHNIYFSHRLYRQHCTLQKGYFVKDLRIVNRKAQHVAIVDNSAFSFMCQINNGIPIIPFYHFAKDKQLLFLLDYLKKLVLENDMRQMIKQTFFWDKYTKSNRDGRKLFMQQFSDDYEERQLRQWKN